MPIPLHKPFFTGRELANVQQVIDTRQIDSDGPFTRRCSEILHQVTDAPGVLMTPSCTDALEMAAILCDFAPGDEVIMPSFTFVSTAIAMLRAGGKPVFVDICPKTLNLAPERVQEAVTPRTRAIVAVHYAGVGCDMAALQDIATRHRLVLIEDAAHGLSGTYRGRALGAIGQLGCFSFHSTKNYACGEGGALVVNDGSLLQRAVNIRDKGTNRRQFLDGQVDKYTWVDVGSSFVPSELACAFLLPQLEDIGEIRRQRERLFAAYMANLSELAADGLLSLPHCPPDRRSSYHLFHALAPTTRLRDRLLAALRAAEIGAAFHFVPLHLSPMGERLGYRPGGLPITEDIAARLVRLPLFNDLAENELQRVVEVAASCLRQERRLGGMRAVA